MSSRKNLLRHLSLLLAGLTLAACTTFVESRLTSAGDTNAEGLRYWLPAPHILLTPQANGSMKVETVYLPDSEHEYTIDASSFLSKLDLHVTYDSANPAFLSSVVIDSGTGEVADTGVQRLADIAAARINAEQAAEAELREEAEADRDAAITAVRALNVRIQTLEESLSDVEIALNHLDPAQANYQSERRRLELERAQKTALRQTLIARRDAYVAERLSDMTPEDVSALNAPGLVESRFQQTYGPMLFRVETTDGDNGVRGVQLRAVSPQLLFASIPGAPTAQTELTFSPIGVQMARWVDGIPTFTMIGSAVVDAPSIDLMYAVRAGEPVTPRPAAPAIHGRDILVSIERSTRQITVRLPTAEPGSYELLMPTGPLRGEVRPHRFPVFIPPRPANAANN